VASIEFTVDVYNRALANTRGYARATLHGFACASCTEPGSTANPSARIVATASTAAIKSVQLNLT
jgi:hypothetical protein